MFKFPCSYLVVYSKILIPYLDFLPWLREFSCFISDIVRYTLLFFSLVVSNIDFVYVSFCIMLFSSCSLLSFTLYNLSFIVFSLPLSFQFFYLNVCPPSSLFGVSFDLDPVTVILYLQDFKICCFDSSMPNIIDNVLCSGFWAFGGKGWWEYKCAGSRFSAVFSRVFSYLNWIQNQNGVANVW